MSNETLDLLKGRTQIVKKGLEAALTAETRPILDVLQPLCCARCSLRLLIIREKEYYFLPSSVLHQLLHPNHHHQHEVGICPLCLGGLQAFDRPAFLDPLVANTKSLGYDATEYMLNIAMPPSLRIRSFRAWYFLRSKFPQSTIFTKPVSECVDVKEVMRWVGSQVIENQLNLRFNRDALWNINWSFEHKETEGEQAVVAPPQPEASDPTAKPPAKRRKFGDSVTKNALDELSEEQRLQILGQFFPTEVKTGADFSLSARHMSLFVAGRYTKFKRNVSQSPFWIGGKKLTEHSVEEIINEAVVPPFQCETSKFSSSGREDVDVRMLGRGRPFMVEILDPKRSKVTKAEVEAMQTKINSLRGDMVKVADLQIVSKAQTGPLKEGEELKKKHYRCVIWFPDPIAPEKIAKLDLVKDLVVQQKTPIRVLHRRVYKVRPKTIHSIRMEFVDSHYAIMNLVTSAGTYVKEFVHGDLGRTQPNVGTLLGVPSADLLVLDVMAVDLDFPPVLDPTFNPSAGVELGSIMLHLPDPGSRIAETQEDDAS